MQVLGAEVRRTWQSVPSVRDLQCAIEAAWQAGFDPAGGTQLDYRVVRPALLQTPARAQSRLACQAARAPSLPKRLQAPYLCCISLKRACGPSSASRWGHRHSPPPSP